MTDIETIPNFVKVKMIPIECDVMCPCCLHNHSVPFSEDFAGYFAPDNGEQFITCDCGQYIEAIGFRTIGDEETND